MSIFPLSFAGMGTETSLACANGMSAGSGIGDSNEEEMPSKRD